MTNMVRITQSTFPRHRATGCKYPSVCESKIDYNCTYQITTTTTIATTSTIANATTSTIGSTTTGPTTTSARITPGDSTTSTIPFCMIYACDTCDDYNSCWTKTEKPKIVSIGAVTTLCASLFALCILSVI